MRFRSPTKWCAGFGLLALVVFAFVLASPAGATKHQPGVANSGHRAVSRLTGEGMVLTASLAPSVPSDPTVFGAAAGSKPWSLTSGHVTLGPAGTLEVNIAGLIITTTGTNPVPDLAASLYCNGTSVGTTDPAPFSTQGNAHVHATLTMPAFCPAPAVLLNPSFGSTPSDVKTGIYIAFDGTT
jgi:hypothetical protein